MAIFKRIFRWHLDFIHNTHSCLMFLMFLEFAKFSVELSATAGIKAQLLCAKRSGVSPKARETQSQRTQQWKQCGAQWVLSQGTELILKLLHLKLYIDIESDKCFLDLTSDSMLSSVIHFVIMLLIWFNYTCSRNVAWHRACKSLNAREHSRT